MRFVWAVAAFVLAAVMIGAGVAQRTIFQGPRTDSVAVASDSGAAYTLIDGAVLASRTGEQTLSVTGAGPVFVAYGRTDDVKAWLSDAAYNDVTLSGTDGADSALVTPTATAAATPAPTDATTAPTAGASTLPAGRSPVGSDLWLNEFQQDDQLVTPLQLPAGMSVLVASDGTAVAPADISISWPVAASTPWAGPLIVLGGLACVVGVVLYVLGIRHVRRSKGPRRKGLPLAPTEPIDLSVEAADKGVVTSGPPRRALTRGRRALVVAPAVVLAGALFAGCSGEAWPQLGGTPETTPTPTVVVPEGQAAPAVTEAQADRIVDRISETVATADTNRDATLAATRLSGAALAARQTNYTLRGAIADQAALPAIPTGELYPLLPQAIDGWPRTVLAVVDSGAGTTSIMTLVQADPWSEYTLSYIADLEANAAVPEVAAPYVGAAGVQPDSAFLSLPPDQLSTAYADVLTNGDNSTYAGLFESSGDDFRKLVADNRAARAASFAQTGAQTGSLTFTASAGTQQPVSLLTVDSGAIVAIDVQETDEVKPTTADAVIKVDGNPQVKTLTGVDQSQTGFATTFSDQLFFYVPGQGSTEKIRLLGYASNLLSAKVL